MIKLIVALFFVLQLEWKISSKQGHGTNKHFMLHSL